ncbi:MAG: beta-lactamase family protein [Chloroflexi bacterium]|nr:beta-lactamase family protein [Chloroflexota bacterium]
MAALPAEQAHERAIDDVLARQRSGAYEPRDILMSEENRIVVLVFTTLTEQWLRIQLGPMGFMVQPAPPPPGAIAGGLLDEDVLRAEIAAYLDRLAAAVAFSGTVLVANDGVPLFEGAYGVADRETGAANTLDTLFNIGSINKSFTAVAVAQLAQQGLLSFDDPLSRHLPGYRRDVADRVTLHHLLTHTSGMGDIFGRRFEAVRDQLRTVQDYRALVQDQPLQFEPGSRWSYSNAGFVVLGAVIETVSGEDYYDYVLGHIFAPAGMGRSDSYPRDAAVPDRAIGYTHDGPDGLSLDTQPNSFALPYRGNPSGGGYTTAPDLLRFDRALRGHLLLSPEYTDIITTDKVSTALGSGNRYAYGFGDDRVNGARIVWHNGGAPGVSAWLDMYFDLGYTAAILSNYDMAAMPVASWLRRILTIRAT